MARTVTYLFGRLNIIAQESDKSTIYKTALSPSIPALLHRFHKWGFSDVMLLHDEEFGDIYEGYLVKYKDQEAVEVVDTEARMIEDENVRNLVAAHSRFFLHLASGIIAYHPVGNQISGSAFVARFAAAVEHAFDDFFISAEILPINEPELMQEAIRRFSRIDRLSIYLHPSNPSNRQIWRRIDERLRAMNAMDYREEYHSKGSDGGLNPDVDKSIGRKIAMAEDGYGHAEVKGIREGKKRTISTRTQPLSADAPSDAAPSATVLRALSDTFSSVLRRFQK
ncbi:MAG: DUF4747 family protein [Acidobacteriaceae bacterium]